ncbi:MULTISPECIES: chemotaxis protein [unclassified Clostridium]|uniref:chemotaxis protein n=1 Tax=unclassified Clostridium TaxID=2614128 RepID=UPI00338E3BD3
MLIFGTGNYSIFVEGMLNSKVKILAYVDNDKNKWNCKKNDKTIISPENIEKYDFDYIVIASQFNEEIYDQLLKMNVNKKKIFQHTKFMDNYWNYYKFYVDYFISDLHEPYDLIITGISYASSGFKVNTCIKKAFKLAFASQDLFYDYHTIKYLLENYKNKMSKVKRVIIGLSYYSFEYDMSLSAMRAKTTLYYDVIKQSHNFKDVNNVYEEFNINENIAYKLLNKKEDNNFDFNWTTLELKELKYKEKIGRKQAEIDCRKNYPKTVNENIEIFESYLKILKDNNIQPIVVVFPTSKYYNKYFSKRIEDKFHSIINEAEEKYKFQYIDYFRSERFNDDDFQDVSHLNINGAEKFTQILNQIIQW